MTENLLLCFQALIKGFTSITINFTPFFTAFTTQLHLSITFNQIFFGELCLNSEAKLQLVNQEKSKSEETVKKLQNELKDAKKPKQVIIIMMTITIATF